MIWYWKKEIVPKRHLGTVDGFWAGDVDWLRIDGSFAHGDVYGVLLKSALAMVMDMNRLFIYDERSVRGTTVFWESSRVGAILFYFQSWTTSSWKILLRISWFLRDSYIFLETSCISEEFRLHLRWWVKNIYKHFNKVFNIISKMCWNDGISKSIGEYNVFYTSDIEGMSKFMLDVNFKYVCKERDECHVERGCGSLSPLWGCNLALVRQAFIESSVVKLDYGKVSTTDLSSFDIPLWYTELQEMIWDIDLWVWVNLHGAQATLNTVWSFI